MFSSCVRVGVLMVCAMFF